MKFLKRVLKIVLVVVIVVLVLGFFNQKKQEKKKDELRKEASESSSAWEKEQSKTEEKSKKEKESSKEESKEEPSKEEESLQGPEPEPEPEPEEESEEPSAAGIRPDVKEAIDAYEAFIDEYCEFVTLVSEDPTNAELMAGYLEYMVKLEEEEQKMKALDKDLTDEEEDYYLEVLNRCNQKLTETAFALE